MAEITDDLLAKKLIKLLIERGFKVPTEIEVHAQQIEQSMEMMELGSTIRSLVEQESWLPAAEALPFDGSECLVLTQTPSGVEGIALADYLTEEGFQFWNIPAMNVLYWRPLPELPWKD